MNPAILHFLPTAALLAADEVHANAAGAERVVVPAVEALRAAAAATAGTSSAAALDAVADLLCARGGAAVRSISATADGMHAALAVLTGVESRAEELLRGAR